MRAVDMIAKQYYVEAQEVGEDSKILAFEQASRLVGLHITRTPDKHVGGSFLADSGELVDWSLVDEGARIAFERTCV
jgi:hypothetical protein